MKKLLFFAATVIAAACSSPDKPAAEQEKVIEEVDEATEIVMTAIEKSGGDLYENMNLAFDFRDRKYTGMHNNGLYEYVRVTQDSVGEIIDVLNNDGYYRTINGEKAVLADTMAAKYARSVNSVLYFALLPDGLNDDAVIREYMGTKDIKGKSYHKIKVTFEQEGGGEDFQDVFIYWFDTTTYDMDYMAYLYYTDGGGMRFREALNPRVVNGIKFLDYNNLKPTEEIGLDSIDDVYLNGGLELLSEIKLENIEVTPIGPSE